MPISLDGFKRLTDTVAELGREADRAQGRLDSLTESLLKETKCRTLEECQEKVEKLKAERQKAYEEYAAEMAAIVDEFGREEWMADLLPALSRGSKSG